MSASGSAKSRMERIMRLHDQIDEIKGDIREVYAKDKDAFDEREALAAVYLNAYNGASHTHAREASQTYAEAKGRDAGSSSGRTAEFDSANAGSNPAPVTSSELTDTQEQPETDEPCDCSERVKPGEYYHCPKCDTEWFPEEDNSPSPETPQAIADEEASPPAASSATLSNPQPSSPGAVKAPEADSSPASGATLSEADVPAFLRTERRKTSADYRPHCKHPDNCGSSNPTGYCYQCRRDMKAASETEAA